MPKLRPIKVAGAMAMKCIKKEKICKNLEKGGIIGKYLSEESWSEERKLEKVAEKMEKDLNIGKENEETPSGSNSGIEVENEERNKKGSSEEKAEIESSGIEVVDLRDSGNEEEPKKPQRGNILIRRGR